jgi:hypothetical protein
MEDGSPDKALATVAKNVTNLIKQRKFNLAHDLLIVPQRVGDAGGTALSRTINLKLDMSYKRYQHLLAFGSGKEIIAIGDSVIFRRESHLILGIFPNIGYEGENSFNPAFYQTRDPELWEDIYEAHNNDFDVESSFNQKSRADSLLDNALQAGETDEEFELFGEDSDEDYTESRPRQMNLELLLLDVSGLEQALTELYDKDKVHSIAMNLLEALTIKAININNKMVKRNHSSSIVQGYLLDALSSIAQHYNVLPWLTESLVETKSGSEFSEYQSAFWTAYQVQGAESQKVITYFYRKFHGNLVNNEAIYTAYTRSKSTLMNFVSKELLDISSGRGISVQAISGTKIAQKIASLKLKLAHEKLSEEDREVLEMLEYMQGE